LVNSRLSRFSAAPSGSGSKSLHPNGAPLLPKLRGHFAEFLLQSYPERLRLLASPTCVGFGTVAFWLARGFSWRLHAPSWLARRPPSRFPFGLPCGFACTTPIGLAIRPSECRVVFSRPPFASWAPNRGAGIFACFPSATPFGLALGTDSPWDD
jgi:hypothetical protein